MTVTCPICGEYEGEVSSVKAHITSRSGANDPHGGRTGGQYAELLEQRAGGDGEAEGEPAEEPDPDPDPEPEGVEDTEDTEDTEQNAEGDAEEDIEEDMPTQAEYRDQHKQDNDTDDADAGDTPDPAGLLTDLPMVYLIGAMVVILLVGYLLIGRDGGGSTPDPEPAPQQEADEQASEFEVFE